MGSRRLTDSLRLGVISDTHGLLRPEALRRLQGCDHLIHGGDIGGPEILESLTAIAPLTVVRGNNDREPWAASIPEQCDITLAGCRIIVIHDLSQLDLSSFAAGRAPVDLVVSGHSHQPSIRREDGIRYLNPGSAGPRRFRLPVTLALVRLRAGECSVRIVPLLPDALMPAASGAAKRSRMKS